MKYELSKYWEKKMDEFMKNLDDQVRDLVTDALDDYYDSDAFTEDASTYCREQGWKEPK